MKLNELNEIVNNSKSVSKIGKIVEMQELVLFPDGELCTDWDKTTDGLEEYMRILNNKLG